MNGKIECIEYLDKIFYAQKENIDDNLYLEKGEEAYGLNICKIYQILEKVEKKLSYVITEKFIKELYEDIERIKQEYKNEWGEVEIYFINSKNKEIFITKLYDFLQEDIINPKNFIDEISKYELEYTSNNDVILHKNIVLEQLIKVLHYLKVERIESNSDVNLINEFKNLIMPDNESNYAQTQKQFNYVCNELKMKGYELYIGEMMFYDFSPINLKEFANSRIRQYIRRNNNMNSVDSISWKERRDLINNKMEIKKNNKVFKEEVIKDLSSINFMEVNPNNYNQTLGDIINYIEYKLKDNKKFKKLIDYDMYNNFILIEGLLNDEDLINYRKKLQCFRHHSEEDVEKRSKYDVIEKEILLAYGHFICLLLNKVVN